MLNGSKYHENQAVVSDQETWKSMVSSRKKLLFLIGYLVASNHEAVEKVSVKVIDEESMINFWK